MNTMTSIEISCAQDSGGKKVCNQPNMNPGCESRGCDDYVNGVCMQGKLPNPGYNNNSNHGKGHKPKDLD